MPRLNSPLLSLCTLESGLTTDHGRQLMKTETLNLSTPNGPTTAYAALPDGEGNGAAVLLIQEWWGINDHIRDLAGRYAAEGYICVAPDLFRGKVTKDQKEASRLMHELSIED